MTPLRILVADDNPDTVWSYSVLLKLWGYECATALDGFAALETAAAFDPHVILLDLGLPRLDGFEVVRRLRQRPEGVDVLVWIVTGFGQKSNRRRAREADADKVLPGLRVTLEDHLHHANLARQWTSREGSHDLLHSGHGDAGYQDRLLDESAKAIEEPAKFQSEQAGASLRDARRA